jgi:hypothetical protein
VPAVDTTLARGHAVPPKCALITFPSGPTSATGANPGGKALDMLDQMTDQWGLGKLPVVGDSGYGDAT